MTLIENHAVAPDSVDKVGCLGAGDFFIEVRHGVTPKYECGVVYCVVYLHCKASRLHQSSTAACRMGAVATMNLTV